MSRIHRRGAIASAVTAAGAPPTAPPAAVFGRWYLDSSLFNKPISPNPTISPDNAAQISWMVANAVGVFGPTVNSVASIWVADNTVTPVRVIVNFPSCDARSGDPTTMVPIPAGAAPGAGSFGPDSEAPMIVVNADTGEEWDLFKTTKPGVTPLVSGPVCAASPSLWACTRLDKFSPGWTGSGIGNSYRGSGVLAGAGIIRPRDTKLPAGSTWDHAIAVAYPRTRQGSFVAPATMSDGTFTDAASIPMGARIQLNPAFNVATSGLPEWQKQLCRTLQVFGMILVDTGSAVLNEGLASVRAAGYTWPWEPAWARLPAGVVQNFRVVTAV